MVHFYALLMALRLGSLLCTWLPAFLSASLREICCDFRVMPHAFCSARALLLPDYSLLTGYPAASDHFTYPLPTWSDLSPLLSRISARLPG